jgi:hypothetical protein
MMIISPHINIDDLVKPVYTVTTHINNRQNRERIEMNKFKLLACSVLCMLVFTFSQAFAQEKMWVSSDDAKLKADKTSSSATIATLPFGKELNVISLEKRWYRVFTSSGETGWIYRGKVSNTEPEKDEDDGEESFFDDLPGTSIQADASDSSRSIRGLSPEASEYAKSTKTPEKYKRALDNAMAITTEKREVELFLKKGKIGEYAQ